MKYYVFLLLPFLVGCSSNSDQKSPIDSNTTQVDSLLSESFMDDYDWTPEGFKTEHPDEWAVVKPSINIQQREGDIGFGKIDLLVKDYLEKKKISLPLDVNKRIECIAEVCRTRFDISGYDECNMGMCIANGTYRQFKMYINWLYENEAKKILNRNRIVDIDRELELYKNLNDAVYDVCDTIAYCLEGSGCWVGASQIHDLSIDFHKSMFQAIIGAKLEQKRELNVPLDLFDKECKALNDNYSPFEDDQPQDVSHIVNRFKNAFHTWYAYRKSVAAELKDMKFKKVYESITYRFVRIHFLHLKNRFSDIGLMSDFMAEVCLEYDCSDQELLDFNYEAHLKELLENLR